MQDVDAHSPPIFPKAGKAADIAQESIVPSYDVAGASWELPITFSNGAMAFSSLKLPRASAAEFA